MEGNSICARVSHCTGEQQGCAWRCCAAGLRWGAYEALVFCQEHGDTGVDLADGK